MLSRKLIVTAPIAICRGGMTVDPGEYPLELDIEHDPVSGTDVVLEGWLHISENVRLPLDQQDLDLIARSRSAWIVDPEKYPDGQIPPRD